MAMTRSSRNRMNSRHIGSKSGGRPRFFFSSSSRSVTNTSTTRLLLLMSMFALILMSTKLNLILHQAALSNLESSLTNNNNFHLQAPSFTATAKVKVSTSKTAVILLFGVPKHFRLVWTSYMKNIVQRNPLMKFEVYMHMYSDLSQQPFSNARNDEISTNLDSPDDIRAILDEAEAEGIPTMLTTSSQSIFDKSELLSWIQQSDTSFFPNYIFTTLQNVFRQGNSLREAFFCYQKYNTNHWNDNHHVYIFARSDTFLMSPVDIPSEIGVGSVDVIIPSWHSWDGYNDRFAVAGPDAAKVYATKVEGYKEAILARRSHPEPEVEPFSNAETLLKIWLDQNKLNVTEHVDDWAWALLRLRANGKIQFRDLEEFEVENVSLVEHLLQYLE
ncbi:hypothetical protein ACHAWT_008086 [Skeletonema menzelii]